MASLQLILPPLSHIDAHGALMRMLGRSDRLPDAGRGRSAALREAFQVPGESLPIAALLREHAAHDAGEHVWLCADPAYVQPDAAGARLMAYGDDLCLSRDEAEALARPLKPLFGDFGALLEVTRSAGWHLRLPRGAQLPGFAQPDEVLGANLLEHLPQGDAGRRWRMLFNEAQVLLHASEINAARHARGVRSVNALWFWGAGALPMGVQTSLTRVISDDPLTCALAEHAKIAHVPDSAAALDSVPRDARVLLDLDRADASVTERDEWPRIVHALRHGCIAHVDCALVGGERFRIRRWHRLRFWRRAGVRA